MHWSGAVVFTAWQQLHNNCIGYIWIWSGACDQESSNHNALFVEWKSQCITIIIVIPWVWMGSESIAQEAKGRMDCWLRGHEGKRNNNYCFSKIQLVDQRNIKTKHLLLIKARQNVIHLPLFWLPKPALQHISPNSRSTNENAALIIDHKK